MTLSPSALRRRYFWDSSGCAAIFLMIVGGMGMAIAVPLYFVSLEADRAAAGLVGRFRASGTPVEGRVLRTRVEKERIAGAAPRGPKYRTVHTVSYLYYVKGVLHQGHAEVKPADYGRLRIGEPVPIEYLSDEPDTSRVAFGPAKVPMRSQFFVLGVAIVFAVVTGVGVALCLRAVVGSRRRAHLVLNGVQAEATVDRVEIVERQTKQGTSSTAFLHYRYCAEGDGAWHEGRSPAVPVPLRDRWSKGDTILVLYDPKDPARHEPDFYEVRAESLPAAKGTKGKKRRKKSR
jgi:hypothetical protein